MIVPMKKVTVIVQSKDIPSTLKAIAGSGVLHVEHQNVPTGEDITVLEQRHRDLEKAIEALPASTNDIDIHDRPIELVREILGLVDRREVLKEGMKKIEKDIAAWREWGDFNPELIYDLERKNIQVRLCKLTRKEMRGLPDGIILEELFRKGNIFYCAIVSREEASFPFEALHLPEQGLNEMTSGLEKEQEKLEEIEKRLHDLSRYKNALISYVFYVTSVYDNYVKILNSKLLSALLCYYLFYWF